MHDMRFCAFWRDQSRSNSASISVNYYDLSLYIAPFYVLSKAMAALKLVQHDAA